MICQFDLASGTELPAVSLGSRGNLHYIQVFRGSFYVAALDDGAVYRYVIGVNNELVFQRAYNAFAPIDVAFSPDGREMFVSGHRESDLIYRFAYDAANDDWIATAQLDAGTSLGRS